ncbi:MAG TPA: hypothetical protein VJQ55_01145, partial [Candidatus Binatia bacterium]|nr:hypothetical protein [Candidatus Binatia bacterium]
FLLKLRIEIGFAERFLEHFRSFGWHAGRADEGLAGDAKGALQRNNVAPKRSLTCTIGAFASPAHPSVYTVLSMFL